MIRVAGHEDMPILVEFARRLVAESRFADFGFIEAKVAHRFGLLIDGAGSIFIAERDGVPVGAMACGVSADWFSEIPMTYEFGVYVAPEHRGSLAGPGLIRAYIRWAKTFGERVNINVGVTTGIDDARVIALYERLGLKVIGTVLSNLG